MTATRSAIGVSAVLLDIEGTTTPIDFVHTTLFSYAREHLEDFLWRRQEEESISADIRCLRDQYRIDRRKMQLPSVWQDDSPVTERASAISYIGSLMDRDAKCTALKSLQGKIWQEGYEMGHLRAEVFPDVPPAFSRWSSQKKTISIFSSGSVLAQRLLFTNTRRGDLSRFLHPYFDTTAGNKSNPESYRKISSAIAVPCTTVLFISDTVPELDAARAAGMETTLCVRGAESADPANTHRIIRSFDEVLS